ncbi:SMI1/KNR4 family protein [Lysinibacillus sp. NPDC056959]|uniref:SMI1/KNR4 family protein n=1 Tax=Lysinibacillus sp. NPDC056959 TaxID=3345981 RepID=UPI003645BBC8
MVNEVITNAKEMIQRSGTSTRIATVGEINDLNEKLDTKLPEWLIDLMTTVEVCDSELVVPFDAEDEDPQLRIEFLNPKCIIEECLDAVPGCAVFENGYICIGVEIAIGDAYAINIHEGNNPPVYLLDHEYGEETERIIENKRMVVKKISDLFLVARINK